MPSRRGFKRIIPLSSRRLRLLASRVKNVEKTIDSMEELVKLESEKRKTNASTSENISSEEINSSGKLSPSSEKIESISDKNSTNSESTPTTPSTFEHNSFSNEMDYLNPPDPRDPMMRPQGLPIVVPPNLREILIPINLLKFFKLRHEDPAAHVERFEELLVLSLVTDLDHYLIWFPIP